MRAPDRRDLELNEALWWSRWARLRWHGDGYLLSSDTLREPFFNRGGALTCGAVSGTVPWAEGILRPAGAVTTLLVFDSCAAAGKLAGSGYRQAVTMTVLCSASSGEGGGPAAGVRRSEDPETWTSAYLRSFYGDEGLTDAVRPIVSSLRSSRAVTLLECRKGGETAGVLALFRTPRVAGVYCVGTVPQFRETGVATALLARAREMASEGGRRLALQTLKSDGALRFYRRRGFAAMYSKLVLARKLK